MKEAAGEANMTVVTIVLIALVLGVGTLIVTQLMGRLNTNNDQECGANEIWNGSECVPSGVNS